MIVLWSIFLYFVNCLSEESCRTDSCESAAGQGFLSSLGTGDAVGKRELHVCLGKLHTIDTFQVLSADGGCSDNLDGSWASAVTTGHFIIQLRDSSSQRNVSEFAVHIVGTRTGGITKPDTVVLDNSVILFNNLHNVQDFTRGLLHLSELMHVIPELGLGDDCVGGKDDHPVSFRVWDISSRGLAAHNLKLLHNSGDSHSKLIDKLTKEENRLRNRN